MKRKLLLLIATLSSIFYLGGCTKSSAQTDNPSATLGISEFNVYSGTAKIAGTIDETNKEIKLGLPDGSDVTSLKVEAKFTSGATMYPESGYSYNFVKPIVFTVTKGDKSVSYKVMAGTSPSIKSATLPAYYRDAVIGSDNISFEVTYGTNLSSIRIDYTLPTGCTGSPASGSNFDLTKSQSIVVSNSLGVSTNYAINVKTLAQETAVRAVWVPDPTHTDVLLTYKKTQEFVNLLDELNLNTIFLGTWAREKTLFKSQVLKDNTNYATVEDGCLLGSMTYDGPSGDAIKELITLAHAKGIKVIFWFEYGFMRDGGANPSSSHPILSVHPDWDGIGNDGKPSNYNGTDYYLNSYDPDVQEFIIKLIEESITKYPEVDGIQGDDRLPAAPRNSGYNPKTREAYYTAKGVYPPTSYDDQAWVRWRLDNLNAFGKKLYDRVKAKKSSAIVCFSPNPYPWCEDHLMQDWPSWIKSGIVQLLSVQDYREDVESYQYVLSTAKNYITPNTNKSILNPGIYLRNTATWESVFVGQMKADREEGTNGEAFFYNEGLKLDVNKKVIKAFYTGKALFPNL